MSLLNDVFAVVLGGASYSTTPRNLSENEIRGLISQTRISSLSQQEVIIVEEALVRGRNGGMISLAKIDEILKELERSRKITSYDRSGVMRVFKNHMR